MPSAHGRPGPFGETRVRERTIALINAAGPPALDVPSAGAITQLLSAHGEPDPRVAAAEIPALIAVAAQLHAVCAAATDGQAADAINALFAAYAHPPRLTDHDQTRWHLHLDGSDDGPLHEWIATSGALALATLFAEHGRSAWGLCRAPECGRAFLRIGDARRRTACSERCATRTRVREHRRRAQS